MRNRSRFRLFIMAISMVTALVCAASYYRTPVTLASGPPQGVQENRLDDVLQHIPGAGGFVQYLSDGKRVCRSATPEESIGMEKRDPNVRLRPISPIRPNQQAGLKITLRGTQQLESFPQAKAAFLKAAATWEALIVTPISIVVDVDFGPTRFGKQFRPNEIGGTLSQELI